MTDSTKPQTRIAIRGPLRPERLAPYCIAVAVWLAEPANPNRQAVNCKVCGDRLEKGEGTEAVIRGLGRYFLCPSCAGIVHEARATFEPKTARCAHCKRELVPLDNGGWTATSGEDRPFCTEHPEFPGVGVAHVLADAADAASAEAPGSLDV